MPAAMTDPSPSELERILLSELEFECTWFLQAWEELGAHLARSAPSGGPPPIESKAKGWSYIDRMLTHLQRIDRIVNPSRGHDSPESFARRTGFAESLRGRIPADLFPAGGWSAARNIVEHAHEYFPDFLRDSGPVGPPAIWIRSVHHGEPPRATPSFRAYDPETGECVVLGRRLNLYAAERAVRRLSSLLPRVEGAPLAPPTGGPTTILPPR